MVGPCGTRCCLASAGSIPGWLPATTPPSDLCRPPDHLPDCCESSLPDGWLAQAEAAGACVLRHLRRRDDMLAAALERLGRRRPEIDPDLAADFLALGYCHFQVELLTRKLHYTSNLDEAALQAAALAAADATLPGDAATARRTPSIGLRPAARRPRLRRTRPNSGCST